MLADFVLRLATGMTFALLLLSPWRTANPTADQKPLANASFFRTQLLVALALCVGAILWLWPDAGWPLLGCLVIAAICAFVVSAIWSLERSPGGVTLLTLTVLALATALVLRDRSLAGLVGGFSSALLLGAAMSAM